MQHIAFLGTGEMGTRMALTLIKAGHHIHAWNRSKNRCQVLADAGATVCSSPYEAATNADIVISMIRDDQASKSVWLGENGAMAAMHQDAVGIECSTISVKWSQTLAQEALTRGISMLAAPVAGSLPQAEQGQLIFFTGGDEDIATQLSPLFDQLGSAQHHVGDMGSAAALKLAVNGLFSLQVSALAELLNGLSPHNLAPQKALDILRQTPVCSPIAAMSADMMINGKFDPLFPVELVVKDLNYLINALSRSDLDTPVRAPNLSLITRTGDAFNQAHALGLGGKNITAIWHVHSLEKS